jgi:hypothetical protein
MKLSVKSMTGNMETVEVSTDDSIAEVKGKLGHNDPSLVRLIHEGKQLDDTLTVGGAELADGAELFSVIRAAPSPEIKCTITTLTGKEIVVQPPQTANIKAIKEMLQDKEGIPPDQQNLWFPMKEGTADALPAASAFDTWSNWSEQLEDPIRSALTSQPLKQGKDGMFILNLAEEQNGEDAKEARAFLILSLRASPSNGDDDAIAEKSSSCCILS